MIKTIKRKLENTTETTFLPVEKKKQCVWNVSGIIDINMTQEEFDNFDPKNATKDVLINYSRQSKKLIDAMKSIIADPKKYEKGQVWKWLFEKFEENDGRKEGEYPVIEFQENEYNEGLGVSLSTILEKAESNGWISYWTDEPWKDEPWKDKPFYLLSDEEEIKMQVLTKDFCGDLKCVTDEIFLQKWKKELQDLKQIVARFEDSDSDSEKKA